MNKISPEISTAEQAAYNRKSTKKGEKMKLVAYQGSISDGYFSRITYNSMDQAISAMSHEDRGAYSLHDIDSQRLPIDDIYDNFVAILK